MLSELYLRAPKWFPWQLASLVTAGACCRAQHTYPALVTADAFHTVVAVVLRLMAVRLVATSVTLNTTTGSNAMKRCARKKQIQGFYSSQRVPFSCSQQKQSSSCIQQPPTNNISHFLRQVETSFSCYHQHHQHHHLLGTSIIQQLRVLLEINANSFCCLLLNSW